MRGEPYNYGEKKKAVPIYRSSRFRPTICISTHKARRVIDQIHGRSYEETLMILELMLNQACCDILKLVYSTTANANHNKGLNETSLIISRYSKYLLMGLKSSKFLCQRFL
ncbi:putative ribosomal protein L22/L17 [Rosa chinensis]|uniref:Putative ribosomal protein L22/L17 n=1 Tax=Rosa chinensis TaxID=74649 RepID=A0A2P6PUU0_ROSCH|nr:putative ribosomal protein L22/L17 [Rosa chinensis]